MYTTLRRLRITGCLAHKMMGAVAESVNQQGELSDSHWNNSVVGARDHWLSLPAVLRWLGCYWRLGRFNRWSACVQRGCANRLDFLADRARVGRWRHPFAPRFNPPFALAACPATTRNKTPDLIA